MCPESWVCGWVGFEVGGKRFFWLCDLKLGQAMRNLACDDQSMLLVLCRLLTAKTRSVRELSQKPAFIGCRLSTRVFSVYLVDELVLAFYNRLLLVFVFFWMGSGVSGEQVSIVLVSWELMLFLFIYLLFRCFIVYLFILGKRSIYNKI